MAPSPLLHDTVESDISTRICGQATQLRINAEWPQALPDLYGKQANTTQYSSLGSLRRIRHNGVMMR